MGHGLIDHFLRILVIFQPAVQVGVVGFQVEVAVAGEVESDDARLAFGLGLESFVDGDADGMRRLGRREDAFGAGELPAASNTGSCLTATASMSPWSYRAHT